MILQGHRLLLVSKNYFKQLKLMCMRINLPERSGNLIAAFTGLCAFVLLSLLSQGCKKHDVFKTKEVDIRMIADNMVSPIQVVASPGSERLYVVDQIGKVWVIDKDGHKRTTP